MLVVTTNDGMVFTGYDAKDVVRQMKATEWAAPARKRDYMREVVMRVSSMTGVEPREPIEAPERAVKLLRYLESVKLIRVRVRRRTA